MPSLALGLSLRGQLNNSVFNPKKLFTASEVGVWFDPSDTSTLFQDSAGTTPVTAAGQPVGKILDKSGNNFHATQATSTQRPTYQIDANGKAYLLFDGVDDNMVTGTITPSTNKSQAFFGLRKTSDLLKAVVAELSTTSVTNNGSLTLLAPGSVSATNYVFSSRGTVTSTATATPFVAPLTNVVTTLGDIPSDTATLRVNGVVVATSSTDQGTGNYLAYPIYIGSRAGTGSFFNGRLYSMIMRFGLNLTTGDIASTESWVNSKTGAY